MSIFAKRLVWFLTGLFTFATVTASLALTVTYKPFGVPDSRRAEYEEKVAELKQRRKLIRELAEQARPKAVVDHDVFDFGMINPHETKSHTFQIRNEGSDPLAVELVDTSCKCTVGKLANSVLAPGESTDVTLTWNAGYKAEEYVQTATLSTNDPLKKSILLTVKGEVKAKFIAPEQIAFNKTDPGKLTKSSFVVFSQMWDDFVIKDVRCDREDFDWHAEPISNNDTALADRDPSSAWRLNLFTSAHSFEDYAGDLTLVVQPEDGSETLEHKISFTGKVRSPINFYSPDIHKESGLDIGVVESDQDRFFHLVARVRGDVTRHVEVLDVEPKELSASLEPMKAEGSYRLTITVPKGCPTLQFNAEQKHGYVQVGDPTNTKFSNWFPLKGAVVNVER